MRARKNRAFFVETLIITFLLLVMLVILVRIFGAAAEKSRYASRRTRAAQAAQNVVTMFEAGEGAVGKAQQELIDTANDEYSDDETPQTTVKLRFNSEGIEDEEGDLEVSLYMTCEVRSVGYMITGNISIVSTDAPDEDLARLDTARYYPDAPDAVLSGDAEIDFGEISVVEPETESEAGSADKAQADIQTEAAS